MFAPTLLCTLLAAAETLSPVDRYNTVVGTQTIGAAYQFTDDSRLLETAKAIRAMGAHVIKFKLGKDYAQGPHANVKAALPGIKSLTDLARDEPSHRAVLDLPFANFVLWAYTFTGGWWDRGYAPAAAEREYREFYDLARWLLTTYDGSGKSFYLGHWEGDWHLRRGTDRHAPVAPEAAQGMIDWLNTRQRAVDDAKRDTPHHDVQVWNYVEVNLVKLGMSGGDCVTTRVLPQTNVDFVSYSAYDCQLDLPPALDFIESKLPAKPSVPGKRVFIGEYGFPVAGHTPAWQDAQSRRVLRAALRWGCPFVLYWELYNNEVEPGGRQRGFWLIDDKGVKQPIYETHRQLLECGRDWVRQRLERDLHPPTLAEYLAALGEGLR